jgi:hypothetical protein
LTDDDAELLRQATNEIDEELTDPDGPGCWTGRRGQQRRRSD